MQEKENLQNRQENDYDESQIQILEGLEPVRKRPGMYIGSTDSRGLHHLIYEVVDNSIDEAMAGFCTHIEVTLTAGGSARIRDNGRGIPTGIHPKTGRTTLEVAVCMLHAGGKFGGEGYKVSGGLHGVGVSVVNALSTKMIATIWRDGRVVTQTYAMGHPTSELTDLGPSDETGTQIEFFPDPEIFESVAFDYDLLRSRFREMAFLNKGICITLRDERGEKPVEQVYEFEGGIKSFVEYLNRNKTLLLDETIYMSGQKGMGIVEVAMQYNDSFSENVHSFANNINTHEGGAHETGFRSALTKAVNDYARKYNLLKEKDENLSGEDIREGLVAVISVKLPDPQFEGQTKTKLGNSYMRTLTDNIVYNGLSEYLEENPKNGKRIVEKCILAMNAREAARKARDMTRKKSGVFSMPAKLADCTSKDVSEREIFIVEGDSAGGSATQGRDSAFQAILPLWGKMLNVEKARADKVYGNDKLQPVITALGAGIGDEFDLSKLRYHKVIIMADADVDGAHIRTLLLTFFFRFMRPLIEQGYVYAAVPPLYKLSRGKNTRVAYSDPERDQISAEMRADNPNARVEISRYKGLGEMNPEELWETTMDPRTRTLKRIQLDDAIRADAVFNVLMGEKVEPRKEFIENKARYAVNLDY